MRKFLTAAIFTLFAGSALAQTSGPIGDAMPPTGYLNFVYSGAFNLFYNGTNYQRWTGATVGDVLGTVQVAPYVLSLNTFYNGTGFQRWTGLAVAIDGQSNSTPAPWSANLLYGFNGTTWDRLRTITTQADAQAAGTRGLVTSSFGYAYNGTTWDMLRIDASNNLMVNDATTRPGEDSGNDWRRTFKAQTNTYTPAYQDTAAFTALTIILSSVEVISDPNFCVYVTNTAGGAAAALSDVQINTSPDNTNWTPDLSWISCDSLAVNTTCVLCVSNNAYRFIRVQAQTAGATTTTRAWYTSNKN